MDAMQIIDTQTEIIRRQNDIINRIASVYLQHEAITQEERRELRRLKGSIARHTCAGLACGTGGGNEVNDIDAI